MPALPDRSGRELPAETGVVVVGGGYAGINAARELARRGVAVTLLEAHTLGWGASTRNGGIVHAGYKWSAGQLIKRYGAETGTALYQETLESYELVKRLIADEGDRLRLPRGRPPRAGLCAVARPGARRTRGRAWRRSASTLDGRAARADPRGDRHATRTSGRWPSRAAGSSIPGATSRAWRRPRTAAGADLHEGVRARRIRRQARRRRSSSRRPRGTILRPGRVRRDERLHRRRRAVAASTDHPDRVVHHRHRAAARGPRPRAVAEGPARSSTRRTSCTTGTCRRTAGWSSAAARRSCRHRSTRPPRILWRGLLEVHPQLADHRIEYAWGGNVGFTFDRMPHVGRTKDGVTYAMGCCGTGVALMTYLGTRVGAWLAGGEAPALTQAARSRSCRRRTRAGRGSCPFAGEWFRLQDRLAARSRANHG